MRIIKMDYYGNNDWRDYLAHYGVKGMKWRNHKYITGENGRYTYALGKLTGRFGTDKTGVNRTGYKTTSKYLSLGKNNEHRINLGKTTHPTKATTYSAYTSFGASKKAKTKKIGRLSITRDQDGISLEYTKKKKAKDKVDKILEKKKRSAGLINTVGTRRWNKTLSTGKESGVKATKPLKRKKKVEAGGTGVKRGEFKKWYSTLNRAGRDTRKGLSNNFSTSTALKKPKKNKKPKGYTK